MTPRADRQPSAVFGAPGDSPRRGDRLQGLGLPAGVAGDHRDPGHLRQPEDPAGGGLGQRVGPGQVLAIGLTGGGVGVGDVGEVAQRGRSPHVVVARGAATATGDAAGAGEVRRLDDRPAARAHDRHGARAVVAGRVDGGHPHVARIAALLAPAGEVLPAGVVVDVAAAVGPEARGLGENRVVARDDRLRLERRGAAGGAPERRHLVDAVEVLVVDPHPVDDVDPASDDAREQDPVPVAALGAGDRGNARRTGPDPGPGPLEHEGVLRRDRGHHGPVLHDLRDDPAVPRAELHLLRRHSGREVAAVWGHPQAPLTGRHRQRGPGRVPAEPSTCTSMAVHGLGAVSTVAPE